MRGVAAASPDAYVEALSGWQRPLVEALRAAILAGGPLTETIKWHNLVFLREGPCILIRAEDERVLVGLWRGKRLVELDPRLKPGGKYELANIVLRDGDPADAERITRLARAAIALNAELGDPTRL